MSTLDDFVAQVEQTLQLPAGSLPADVRDELLDLTRDVAHGVTRIAGPLSTFLLGLAVGAGADRGSSIAAIAELARSWESGPDDQAAAGGGR